MLYYYLVIEKMLKKGIEKLNFRKRIIPALLAGVLIVPSINIDGFERLEVSADEPIKTVDQENQVPDLIVNQEDELSSSNTIVTSNGANEYNLTTFESDVQVEGANGWEAIDTTLVVDKDGGFVTKETKLDVKFSEELNPEESFVKVTNEANQKVEFSLASIETAEGIIPLQKSEGEIAENVITYRDILKGVDLRHIVLNTEIKEDVILKEKLEGLKSINYKLNTKLIPTLSKTGEMVLSDTKGNKIYEMSAPHMSDSRVSEGGGFAEQNHDIEYQLVKKEDHYEVKLIPTSKWLEEDRVYPVYIDPTLVKNVSLDTFVTSAAPDRGHNQYWNSNLGQYVLRVGKYDSSTGTNYALVKMYTLDNLKGANVTSATLKTFVNWSYYATTKTEMWVDKVTSAWSENNVTWNTRPPSIGITSTTAARNEWASFNVTNAVKEVVTGNRTDYGFKFHSNGNEMTHWKQLSAGENGKNITNLSVTYNYPQMQPLTTNPFPSGAGATTGYVDVAWPSVTGATGYRLQMFDGKGWQTVYNGSATSFTTKNKKIWPLSSQYGIKDASSGGIKFRSGDGQELPIDPSQMYSTSSGVATTSKAFQFRVIADYPLGSSAPSKIAKPILDGIIPDTPAAPTVSSVALGTSASRGHFVLDWEEVEGATSYDIQIYNGSTYERIPVGNTTQWSSKGKGIFPTDSQLNSSSTSSIFRKNGDGTDFLTNPTMMYLATDSKYAYNTFYYFVKIIAKSSKGESLPSSIVRVWLPTEAPKVSSKGYLSKSEENSGHLASSWTGVEDAKGYIISLHNGGDKQIIDQLESGSTYWSSKGKGLWPTNLNDKLFKVDQSGQELSINPGQLYGLYNQTNSNDTNYYLTVQSYRGEDTTKSVTDPARYLGKSESLDERGDSVVSLEGSENEAVEINPKYEQMSEPIVEVLPNNDELVEEDVSVTSSSLRSDLFLSWEQIDAALKYQVMIHNGYDYTYFDVPGDVTEWSSYGKKIFPTSAQMENSEFSFRTDEDGVELPRNPQDLYDQVNQKYGTSKYVGDPHYYISVTAVHEDGSRKPSEPQKVKIPLETPYVWVEKYDEKEDGSREIQFSWDKAEDTISELYLYNGKTYKRYDLGERTTWNSDEAKVYPIDPTATEFVELENGRSLPTNLSDLYKRNGMSEEQAQLAPLLGIKIRTIDKQGESSEIELNLEQPENEKEYLDSSRITDETIEDGFFINSDEDSIEIQEVKPNLSLHGASIFRAIATPILKNGQRVGVEIAKKANKKIKDMVKATKSNKGNLKPGRDAAVKYMQNKAEITFKNATWNPKYPLKFTNERFGHVLSRHDVRYWDGTFGKGKDGPVQTFFPQGTTNTQILNALSKTIKSNQKAISNQSKANKQIWKQYTAWVDGRFYRVGIQYYKDGSPYVTQFYPAIQYWRF